MPQCGNYLIFLSTDKDNGQKKNIRGCLKKHIKMLRDQMLQHKTWGENLKQAKGKMKGFFL